MGAALSVFILLSLSVFVVRVASVALRFTGLADERARFQALSAFTGTGFTSRESEAVVNYPVRRRIVSVLMIVGNMGLVTVFATVAASFVYTGGEMDAVIVQLAWLLSGLGLLWFVMLNKTADRILCTMIGRMLLRTTLLGQRRFQRLLQTGDGYSVCEHPLSPRLLDEHGRLSDALLEAHDLTLLAVRSTDGKVRVAGEARGPHDPDDSVLLFGRDTGHEAVAVDSSEMETENAAQ